MGKPDLVRAFAQGFFFWLVFVPGQAFQKYIFLLDGSKYGRVPQLSFLGAPEVGVKQCMYKEEKVSVNNSQLCLFRDQFRISRYAMIFFKLGRGDLVDLQR